MAIKGFFFLFFTFLESGLKINKTCECGSWNWCVFRRIFSQRPFNWICALMGAKYDERISTMEYFCVLNVRNFIETLNKTLFLRWKQEINASVLWRGCLHAQPNNEIKEKKEREKWYRKEGSNKMTRIQGNWRAYAAWIESNMCSIGEDRNRQCTLCV